MQPPLALCACSASDIKSDAHAPLNHRARGNQSCAQLQQHLEKPEVILLLPLKWLLRATLGQHERGIG
jgi:hypothetical protein